MKPEDLKKLIEDAVESKVREIAKEETEKKAAEVEVVKIAVPLVEDKTEIVQKEVDSKNWKSLGEFCKAIYNYRFGGHSLDNRLIFIDRAGNPSVPTKQFDKDMRSEQVLKTLTEGVDSAGGYVLHAL